MKKYNKNLKRMLLVMSSILFFSMNSCTSTERNTAAQLEEENSVGIVKPYERESGIE